ncbi:transporter [Bacterioplanes sanyensis]|uniref:TRAP transporter permease n=1 Tax=Bacterioplanes sanyensis TaxID=1249553 RepID=UPI001677BBFF|nr:TRAP transporter fused permease subunit [Bacterioplanes sanyensis]GGY57599.1 transporter [Bacterioplanes sanyensis]
MTATTQSRWLLWLLTASAVALSVFQIWQGLAAQLSAPVFRPVHLGWVLVLVFLAYPLLKPEHHRPAVFFSARLIDLLFIVAAGWCTWRIARFDYDDIGFLLDGLQSLDQVAGVTLMLLLLEATRRTVGMTMVVVALVFIGYALFGDALPQAIASKGFAVEEMVRFHIFSTNGVFGAPLAIAATVVFMFVLFGAFLNVTGAGQFFIDAAFAAAGKYRGGPAKASVLASAALGSISGSAIANTVTTGSLTIPMMKKLGYKPEQAAGIEAAASTGGQIMPPVMGAGAFVMAQFTGIPYSEILLVSIAPAILYFLCTLLYVHLMAVKLGLQGMTAGEKVREVLARGWHFLVPLVLITALLMMSYSPVMVGIAGCAAVLIAALIAGFTRGHERLTLAHIIAGLKEGALMALPISVACATAGIVVGVVGQTGLGLLFTQFLLDLSGGQLWSVLLLVMVAAIVLGMGLPVTAAYIVLSVMAVPAMMDLGVSMLAAHMIVFWLSQTSNVTPPIALAAFAGAGIAGAKPMGAAVQAFKLAKGYFLIPAMMAFSSLIWTDDVTLFGYLSALLATSALILAFAAAIEGQFASRLNNVWRGALLLLAISVMVLPDDYRWIAGLVILALLGANLWQQRAVPASDPAG